MACTVRLLKAEGAANVGEEVERLKALKQAIQNIKESDHQAGKSDQTVTPWDVQGAEVDGVQQVRVLGRSRARFLLCL